MKLLKINSLRPVRKRQLFFFPEIILTDENITQIKNEMNKTKEISLDEINYYIQNNKWPYNSYISNYLITNKESIIDKIKNTKMKTLEDIQKVFPTRLFYKYFIESTETPISPPPLSNNIYMGKAVAPAEAPIATPSEPKTIHPPFSSENYSKLQSICSTLK